MLIIDRKHVIVHMKKCAGHAFCESIMKRLSPERYFSLGYGRDATGNPNPIRSGGLWKHSTTAEIVYNGGSLIDANATFYLLSDRSIFERMGSYYMFTRRQFERGVTAYQRLASLTFKDFIRNESLDLGTIPEYACSEDGQVLLQYIINHNNISESFERFCRRVGFSSDNIPVFGIANYNTQKKDYINLYDEDDIAFIYNRYSEEFRFLARYGELLEY